jgi:hypothetical protein
MSRLKLDLGRLEGGLETSSISHNFAMSWDFLCLSDLEIVRAPLTSPRLGTGELVHARGVLFIQTLHRTTCLRVANPTRRTNTQLIDIHPHTRSSTQFLSHVPIHIRRDNMLDARIQ